MQISDNILLNNPEPDTIPLKEALLELIWPTRCVGCETPGQLLCDKCRALLKTINPQNACPHCGAPHGQLICTECYSSQGREQFSFSQAVCAVEFEAISARMVVLYKNHNEHRLAKVIAGYLYHAIPKSWFIWADCICWIPVDKKTLRRRGFDQMQSVARQLTKLADKPALPLLTKLPVKDQRELGRRQRRQNLQGSFTISSSPATPAPANVILIDDVLTTGATLDIAAQTLLNAGSKEVRAAAFTRVW
jgi:ComF family protein